MEETDLTLGKVGQSTVQCPACTQFGIGPALGKYCPVDSITAIQGETLLCSVIFGDLGVTARIWESLSVTVSFFPFNILNAIVFRSLTKF